MQDFHKPCTSFSSLFSSKNTKKRGLRLIYHLTFLRTCCKGTTFSCNAKLFCHFFSVKRIFYTNTPPIFILFCTMRSKNKAERPVFRVILPFLFGRFCVVSDNDESCVRQQTQFCPVICITFCQQLREPPSTGMNIGAI